MVTGSWRRGGTFVCQILYFRFLFYERRRVSKEILWQLRELGSSHIADIPDVQGHEGDGVAALALLLCSLCSSFSATPEHAAPESACPADILFASPYESCRWTSSQVKNTASSMGFLTRHDSCLYSLQVVTPLERRLPK